MNPVRTEQLTREFDGRAVVDGLTFSVAPGEIFGLVGPDGAGKTTVLRLLAAILNPTSGDAWVSGHHVVREAEAVKHSIGYMSQRFGLYPDLTVRENIAFYADLYSVSRRERQPRLERLLAFSQLGPFQDRQAGRLSGGMRQKLGLACALIHTPRVLLLDEPTNGVDPVSRRDFWRLLSQLLQEQVAMVVATSYLDEAERCGRVLMLHQGRPLALGPPDEVKRHQRGMWFELPTEDARRVAGILRGMLPADAVALFGDRLHVRVSDEAELARTRDLLNRSELAAAALRRIEPSLEDVFVGLVAREQRGGGEAGA